MSNLGRHLRSRVYYLERRIREGLANRHDREWFSEAEALRPNRMFSMGSNGERVPAPKPIWLDSPRRRVNYGIRRSIKKLRVARLHLNEFRRLQEAAE